jgi:hypothetical protein
MKKIREIRRRRNNKKIYQELKTNLAQVEIFEISRR